MARPSDFTPEIAAEICARIANGQSVREIGRADDMPADRTIWRWLNEFEPFRQQYVRAKEAQADHFGEEILEIADDGTNDWMLRQHGEDDTVEVPNHEHIQRSKLRVDARKWLMSKMAPKKYGDKLDVEQSGQVTINVIRREPGPPA